MSLRIGRLSRPLLPPGAGVRLACLAKFCGEDSTRLASHVKSWLTRLARLVISV